MITIFKRGTNLVRAVVQPAENSQQERTLMERDVVSLSFDMPVFVDFEIGDYANIFGYLYKMNTLPAVQKIFDRNFSYSATLEASMYDLGKTSFLFPDAENNLTVPDFPINAKPAEFLTLIVANLNRLFLGGWTAGVAIDAPEKLIEFNGVNCLEAINQICEAFETEFLVEEKKVSLYKKQTSSGMLLKVGKGEALLSVTRKPQDSGSIITRVYAYGSDKNIGSNYRSGAGRLRMPTSLYLGKNPGNYEDVEVIKIFEEIMPERTGTVTSVGSPTTFADATIPFNVNSFLMPGVTAKVKFTTGQLAGFTFDVSSFNNGSKAFVIIPNNELSIDAPSETLKAEVGDKYVLVDILMPATYITDAEARLEAAALKFLDENYLSKLAFSTICNAKWFRDTSAVFQLGQTASLDVPDMNILVQKRIIGFTRNLRNPFIYTIELADKITPRAFFKVISKI